MKALVTGGGGFVGGRVVEMLLERGWAVRSFGRSARPALEALGVEAYRGDLADAEAVARACAGVDAVFHVAAKAGVWGPAAEYHSANVLGTRNVVAGCRRAGVGRLVLTSTPSVVFDGAPVRGGDESLPYGRRHLCAYTRTKAIAERETLAADSPDLRVCALRPHLVFGPGDPHLLPRVLTAAAAGRLKIVGRGDNRVDLTHVADAAAAHLLALEALDAGRAGGRAYFITQGRPVALWPWLNGIFEALGRPPLRRRIPTPAAYAAGGLCEALWRLARRPGEPPITRFVALQLAEDHYFDIAAARRELGYRPAVPMAEAIDETVKDLKKRGFSTGHANRD